MLTETSKRNKPFSQLKSCIAEGPNSSYSLRKKSKANFHICYSKNTMSWSNVRTQTGSSKGHSWKTSGDGSLDSFKQLSGMNHLQTSPNNCYLIGIHIERLSAVSALFFPILLHLKACKPSTQWGEAVFQCLIYTGITVQYHQAGSKQDCMWDCSANPEAF